MLDTGNFILTYSGNESNTLVTQNCALLSYHAACSGSILPTFWDNLLVSYSCVQE